MPVFSHLSLLILLCTASVTLVSAGNPGAQAPVNWLDRAVPERFQGATFGVPWARGLVQPGQHFTLAGNGAHATAVQTWPIAYWPDGSVKWTAVAVAPGGKMPATLQLVPSREITGGMLKSFACDASITINTGVIEVVIPKSGNKVVESITRNGILKLSNGHLVVLNQNTPEVCTLTPVVVEEFRGIIQKAELEQASPVRAVVRLEGSHFSARGRSFVPFILRLYFYSGGENIRIVHTMIFDGNEEEDFIRGIGLRFDVPMHGANLYDRHVRFAGEGGGVFAEAVQGLTGLRRDPGQVIIDAQLEGRLTPPLEEFPERVRRGLPYIPAFGDYTLLQASPGSFNIRKRTSPGHTWLNSAYGWRAAGAGYVGTPRGGVGFGIRNFWQSYPAQLDITNAVGAYAGVAMWLWAPGGAPMDLRFYHDGMGMDTYPEQWEGLEITYEDYEPGFGRPIGVARTSELDIWVVGATPSREEFVNYSAAVAKPPVLMAGMQHILDAGVFGALWTIQDTLNACPMSARIYNRLNWMFDYYERQVDLHNWYGFWNFGDVMHTYDFDRHVWRYDVGGYAWDNSELSTDIWLWYYFLHTGRADAFRMAEAMTRHTGEVDVHHLGPFAPLGSRHNVLHWGCSAKQLRISTAANRRFYYFLTADERVGDLMEAQVEAHRSLFAIPPLRKRVNVDLSDPRRVYMSFGTDWGSMAAAWLTQWERTGDTLSYQRLRNGMKSIAAQPRGFFTGRAMLDTETGLFEISPRDSIIVSHLSAVFGIVEINAEIFGLIDIPEYREAWLQYCMLYNATPQEQEAALGMASRNRGLPQAHSRLTAFASRVTNDAALARRAWEEFTLGNTGASLSIPELVTVLPPATLYPVEEAYDISTNYAAQWGLAAIYMLTLLDQFPGVAE